MRHLLLLEELHLSAGYLKSLRRDKKKKKLKTEIYAAFMSQIMIYKKRKVRKGTQNF